MRSKYDFDDEVTRFFYDCLEKYYLTFSQTIDETKMNVFMSQDVERLKLYKQYKGWKTLVNYMQLADSSDCKNYFNTIKKYSLLREYNRNGYPVDKIIKHKRFDVLTANDIYRIIRTKADKIHTVINAGEEAIELTNNNSDVLDSYIDVPMMGLATPWYLYNEMFLGLMLQEVIFEGFLSNEGKTRKLMLLAAYVSLVQNKNFLFMSNEMSEKKLRSCFITTVLNNQVFKDKHGIQLKKHEREIILGVYKDRQGEYIRRKIDENGCYIESAEEFKKRIKDNSDEYWQIHKVTEWIDNENHGKLLFRDVGQDYSDEQLEVELRKYKAINNVLYYAYDTLKGYHSEEWGVMKQAATKLKEITKELGMSGFVVFQLTDDSIFTDIFDLSSNNIAGAKGIKHVADALTLGKNLNKEEYYKYKMVCEYDNWGKCTEEELDVTKNYFAIKADKNRAGDKRKIMLFVYDLNFNTWVNVGYLVKKKKIK